MQVVGSDGKALVGGGRNMELAPEGIDVFLLVVDARVFHHVVADSGVGAVGANEKIK